MSDDQKDIEIQKLKDQLWYMTTLNDNGRRFLADAQADGMKQLEEIGGLQAERDQAIRERDRYRGNSIANDRRVVLSRWPWAINSVNGIYLVNESGCYLGQDWNKARNHWSVLLHEIAEADDLMHRAASDPDVLVSKAANRAHEAVHLLAGLLSPEADIRLVAEKELADKENARLSVLQDRDTALVGADNARNLAEVLQQKVWGVERERDQAIRERDEARAIVDQKIVAIRYYVAERDALSANLEQARELLREMRDAVKDAPCMQGRQYVSLGVAVNWFLNPALSEAQREDKQ